MEIVQLLRFVLPRKIKNCSILSQEIEILVLDWMEFFFPHVNGKMPPTKNTDKIASKDCSLLVILLSGDCVDCEQCPNKS